MSRELPVVAVLMSTYNGEKYIREQLDSIFVQKDVLVKLLVRDDGSSDATVDILSKYSINHDIVVIRDGENVGPGESFMRLLYNSVLAPEVQYFAFADQDDIWLEDKLRVAVDRIENSGFDGAVLYSSNQYLYVNGENNGKRYSERQSIGLVNHMTKNTIAGCTFVLNRPMAGMIANVDKPDHRVIKYRLHDAWIMLIAITCANVIYDENAYMLYRIHENNVVGIKAEPIKKRVRKLSRFIEKRDDANIRMITAQEILRLYPGMSRENQRIVRLYAAYQNSWRDKCNLAFNKEIRAGCVENPNMFTLKVLTNFL